MAPVTWTKFATKPCPAPSPSSGGSRSNPAVALFWMALTPSKFASSVLAARDDSLVDLAWGSRAAWRPESPSRPGGTSSGNRCLRIGCCPGFSVAAFGRDTLTSLTARRSALLYGCELTAEALAAFGWIGRVAASTAGWPPIVMSARAATPAMTGPPRCADRRKDTDYLPKCADRPRGPDRAAQNSLCCPYVIHPRIR